MVLCHKFKAETIILANLLMILRTHKYGLHWVTWVIVFFHTSKIKTHLSLLNVKCVNFHAIMDTLECEKKRYCVCVHSVWITSPFISSHHTIHCDAQYTYSCCFCSQYFLCSTLISRGPFHCFCFIVYFAHSFVLNRHTHHTIYRCVCVRLRPIIVLCCVVCVSVTWITIENLCSLENSVCSVIAHVFLSLTRYVRTHTQTDTLTK